MPIKKLLSTVRRNILKDPSYRPYCGNPIGRFEKDGCDNPRTLKEGNGQFLCTSCGWLSSFEQSFLDEVKKAHKSDGEV